MSIKNESGGTQVSKPAIPPLWPLSLWAWARRAPRFWIFVLVAVLAAALSGCAPAGTHALLKGKKYLDEGDYADAAGEFKSATEEMATNAEAWNYLGVAEQHTGQLEDAAKAYQRALELDRDLTEAHYNLGCLWMQEDQPEKAANEFTAFTLQKVNEPEGWLKLGLAQLGVHQLLPAEKSFSTALYWSPKNAEALNGLGLARMERNRPDEAARFFQAAVQNHPDFGPAILNWATVEHEYLHNDRLALQEYLAYLSLSPRPADSDQVNAIVSGIERSPAVAVASAAETHQSASPPRSLPAMEPPEPSYEPPKQQQKRRGRRTETARAETDNSASADQYDTGEEAVQSVQVQPENRIASAPSPSGLKPANEPDVYRSIQTAPPSNQSSGAGFFHWLRSEPSQTSAPVAPLPAQNVYTTPRPVHTVQPAPPVFPRYLYLSPGKPASGNRRAASAMFSRARDYEAEHRYTDALDCYRQAASLDPGWFEAQYNCGVMAYRLRDYQFSLAAYENALAIEPGSADARYNFALALKAAGYVTDAVSELNKILGSNPNDARSHLELGNLYAQKLRDVPRARVEYLKVLQLDPGNPQASNIEFWLSANPQ
ncbi:MAG TPA: tetratricopeptide repeat protein [Verrucomicrobiae bacterium]|nr:tetratricopeptide repeat protein [Verrucomicrobiae bacterium]